MYFGPCSQNIIFVPNFAENGYFRPKITVFID